jgi:bisphosphoglycerate-independent phosphoglycerate mutase (AlkP superfamily)
MTLSADPADAVPLVSVAAASVFVTNAAESVSADAVGVVRVTRTFAVFVLANASVVLNENVLETAPPLSNTVDVGVVTVIASTVVVLVAADEGTAESIPKPNAATATSATRLKVVFVDICFLSISQGQEFPGLGFG